MIARARACAIGTLLALANAGCGETDVVAYLALASCDAGDCAPIDGGDSGGDGDGDGDTCAAATCSNALVCGAPTPRAIVGDSCGDQPWAAPGFRHALCSCGD